MMLTDDDIRDALEAEFLGEPGNRNLADDLRVARAVIAAHEAKAAPAVPQGEPVAWMLPRKGEDCAEFHEADEPFNDSFKRLGWTPLYATPAAPSQPSKYGSPELQALIVAHATQSQPVNRPQNCGTSYCSCIECVCEPEPVTLTDRQFDLICQAIDKADTITMDGDYMMDSDDCIAVVRVMQALFDIAALREKEQA